MIIIFYHIPVDGQMHREEKHKNILLVPVFIIVSYCLRFGRYYLLRGYEKKCFYIPSQLIVEPTVMGGLAVFESAV